MTAPADFADFFPAPPNSMWSSSEDLVTTSSALMDPAGVYQYVLVRRWSDATPLVVCMLNPSTADNQVNDPTIVRLIGRAVRGGYGGLVVVNLLARRAKDPQDLAAHFDTVGPLNDLVISEVIAKTGTVVVGWGAHPMAAGRTAWMLQILAVVGVDVLCLGVTAGGHPRHPLYVPTVQPLVPFRPSPLGQPGSNPTRIRNQD